MSPKTSDGFAGEFESGALTTGGIGTDPDRDFRRLHGATVFQIPKRKGIGNEFEGDLARFAGRERNTLEAFQFTHRQGHGCALKAHVELHNFLTGYFARIRDFGRGGEHGFSLCGVQQDIQVCGVELRIAELNGSVMKRGVGETKAEGKLRGVRLVDVTGEVLFVTVRGRVRKIDVAGGATGVEGVVIQRLLTDGPRPTDDKLAAGIHGTEEDVDQSRTSLNPGEPRREDRRNVFKGPGKSKRAAAEEDQNNGLARGEDFLEKFPLLMAGQPEMSARGGLAGHAGSILSESEDGDIGLFRSFDGSGKFLVRSVKETGTAGVMNTIGAEFLDEGRSKSDGVLGAAHACPRAQHVSRVIGERAD